MCVHMCVCVFVFIHMFIFLRQSVDYTFIHLAAITSLQPVILSPQDMKKNYLRTVFLQLQLVSWFIDGSGNSWESSGFTLWAGVAKSNLPV